LVSEYGEREGIWHILRHGKSLCGAAADEPIELAEDPRPMCWRCREARAAGVLITRP
jgi:hypothetical protein